MIMQTECGTQITEVELEAAFDARFPVEIKRKLRNAKVAIAGLGGLGSNIAVMLARSGVGHLLLVDFDVVDVTNLNRQMYLIKHLGLPKADALPGILREINPYLEYKSIRIKVSPENIATVFADYPIVCEAFDKPDQKAMLVEQILARFKDTIVVSGIGMAGIGNSNAIETRQIMKRLYVCGDRSTDVGNGVGLTAPRVAICAGHQAGKVLELIVNDHESDGRMKR